MSDKPAVESAKNDMRRELRNRLRALTPAFRAEASLVIGQTAASLPAFSRSRCVALFAPLPTEPDLHPLIEEAWAQGKRVVLPLTLKQGAMPRLDWHEVANWDDVVVPGPFGLREPDPLRCPRVAPPEIDCAFIPALGLDETGLRLGRGGGFYDSFLAQAPASLPRIGLVFACQLVPKLPCGPHDQALPFVITEDGLRAY